jgi:hypothetical protein
MVFNTERRSDFNTEIMTGKLHENPPVCSELNKGLLMPTHERDLSQRHATCGLKDFSIRPATDFNTEITTGKLHENPPVCSELNKGLLMPTHERDLSQRHATCGLTDYRIRPVTEFK